MYKGSGDAKAYLQRRGSHSTKPKRNGDTGMGHGVALTSDMNPVAARQALIDEKDVLGEEIRDLKKRLRGTLPFEDYRELKDRRDDCGIRIRHVELALEALKSQGAEARRMMSDAYPRMFMEVARHMLPQSVFKELHNHTMDASRDWCESEASSIRDAASMKSVLNGITAREKARES